MVYTLSDGTVVDVDGRGGFVLRTHDGRVLTGLEGRTDAAPTIAPRLTAFDERVTFTLGFFTFRRTSTNETALDRFVSSEQVGDSVVLHYASRETEATGTLTVSVAQPRVSTRVRVEARAVGTGAQRSVALPFRCDADASFSGFGAQYNQTDQRGEAFSLFTTEQGIGRRGNSIFSGDEHTTYFPEPYWLDWRGFGVLVDTDARVLVDLCAETSNVAWVEVEDDEPLDVTVFQGPTPTEVVRSLGDIVGRPALPPAWSFSPWMAVQGGTMAVEEEVAALEAADVPFSAVWVQDWPGGRMINENLYDLWYRWIWDEELYPDLPGLTRRLREDHGVRFLGYANSFIIQERDHFAPMAEQGLLIENAMGEPYVFPVILELGTVADFTNPATYEYAKGFFRTMVTDLGFSGWMSDFGEWLPTDAVLHEGDARLVHNRYPELWHRASREVMDELRPDGDWVLFTRSGWLRDQQEQQIVWIGDQEADFETTDGLPTVVPAMLNLGLSAVPLVTHDIAGYSGGPSTKELFQRWTELGAFTTFMRTHEGLNVRENWHWDRDEETLAHFRRFARVHEALVPELRTLAAEAHETSVPVIRHLAMVFPSDVPSRAISDEYMLGPTLLVAPVVAHGATTKDVYLPPGTWFHVFTGTQYEGGRRHTIDAPIGTPPVFSLGVDRPELRAIE